MQPMYVRNTFVEAEAARFAAQRVDDSIWFAAQRVDDSIWFAAHSFSEATESEQDSGKRFCSRPMGNQAPAVSASGLKSTLSCISLSTMASDQDDQSAMSEGRTSLHEQALSVCHVPSSHSVSMATQSECDYEEQVLHVSQAALAAVPISTAVASTPTEASPKSVCERAPRSKEFTYSQKRPVPKHENFAEKFSAAAAGAPPTTLMLRNIPNRYTQSEVKKELELLGFEGSFDFLYAPTDFSTMHIVGYAFINFVTAEWAARCSRELEGHVFRKHQKKTAQKAAKVSAAHLQGLQANVDHYEKSAIAVRGRSKGCNPMILEASSSTVDTI